ncbi:MAG: alpha/beta fold hydrolase [Bacillota bacterium]
MLAYESAGTGPAIVLLHGFPLNRSIWTEQRECLSARYRVILPDLPGLGESAPLAETTIAGMAAEVLRLMDHLQVPQFALGGHSMGGYVALALQKLAPERVRGLALICTQAGDDTPEARAGRYATAEKVMAEGTEVLVGAMLPKLFATPDAGAAGEAVAALIRQSSREGVRECLHAMAKREDMRTRLPSISVPTLVLTGQEDRLIPPDRSEGMAAQMPHAVLVKVPNAGHMPMVEQPKEVNQALERWLELVY